MSHLQFLCDIYENILFITILNLIPLYQFKKWLLIVYFFLFLYHEKSYE